jgi:hypothetical protein
LITNYSENTLYISLFYIFQITEEKAEQEKQQQRDKFLNSSRAEAIGQEILARQSARFQSNRRYSANLKASHDFEFIDASMAP